MKIKNKCLLPRWVLMIIRRTIGSSILAQHNTTFEQEWFTTYKSIVPRKVYMGDDTILEAIGKGNIKAIMQVGSKMLFTTITQVFHVPKMKNSLISISKLISEG